MWIKKNKKSKAESQRLHENSEKIGKENWTQQMSG